MENMQPMKTEKESGSGAGTLADSTSSKLVAVTENDGLKNSYETTPATTQTDSPRILNSAELRELQSKAGLVAGALADFQAAGGLVAVKNVECKTPSGRTFTATKLYLVVDGASLKVQHTKDGLDFSLVAVESQLS